MGHLHFGEIIGWVRRWRSMPVLAWTSAAAMFSRGAFASAAREYQRGLDRFPAHLVAPYARLDLSVCLERLGNFDEACDQLTKLASERGPLQELARIRLCHALLLSDRAQEAAKIAALIDCDEQTATLRNELLTVKALLVLDLSNSCKGARAAGRERLALVKGGRRAAIIAPKVNAADNASPSGSFINLNLRRFGEITALRVGELRRFRGANEVVDAALNFFDNNEAFDNSIALAETTNADCFWLWIVASQKLLSRKEPMRARRLLNRALAVEPRSPRVLTLLAQTYLISGESYNPVFAVQLATKACQHAGWQSPKAHAVLAECFYHSGDKLAALTVVQGSRSRLADPQIALLLESLNEQLTPPKTRNAA